MADHEHNLSTFVEPSITLVVVVATLVMTILTYRLKTVATINTTLKEFDDHICTAVATNTTKLVASITAAIAATTASATTIAAAVTTAATRLLSSLSPIRDAVDAAAATIAAAIAAAAPPLPLRPRIWALF